MLYTIYKTKNRINGKIYIGKHQTNNVNDSYYGSGRALSAAIKKYGVENFEKEILFVFDNEKEMNLKEKELIDEIFVNRKDTYNLGVGGEGGPHFRGKKHSKETLAIIKEKRAKQPKPSAEARRRISESNRARPVSDETRSKLSKKAKERYDREGRKEKKEKPSMKGRVWVKNLETMHTIRIMPHDVDRYLSNGYVKGRILSFNKSENDNNYHKKQATCPHCNKTGQELAMRRHHFDNCKMK